MAQLDQDEYQFQQWASRYDPQGTIPDEKLRGIYTAGLDPSGQSGHWADPKGTQMANGSDVQDVYVPPMAEAQGQGPPMDPNDPNFAFQGPQMRIPAEVDPFGPQSAMNPFNKPAHPLLSFIKNLVQYAGHVQHSPTWGAGEALGAVEQAGEQRRVQRLKGPAAAGYQAGVDEPMPEGLSPDEQQIWIVAHQEKRNYVARQQMINARVKHMQQQEKTKAQMEYEKSAQEMGTRLANHLHAGLGVDLYPDEAIPFEESKRGIAMRNARAREEEIGISAGRLREERAYHEDVKARDVERLSQQAARDAAQQGYRSAQFGQGERRIRAQEEGVDIRRKGLQERTRADVEKESRAAARDADRVAKEERDYNLRREDHRLKIGNAFGGLATEITNALKTHQKYLADNPGIKDTPQGKDIQRKIDGLLDYQLKLMQGRSQVLGLKGLDPSLLQMTPQERILEPGLFDPEPAGSTEPSGGK